MVPPLEATSRRYPPPACCEYVVSKYQARARMLHHTLTMDESSVVFYMSFLLCWGPGTQHEHMALKGAPRLAHGAQYSVRGAVDAHQGGNGACSGSFYNFKRPNGEGTRT